MVPRPSSPESSDDEAPETFSFGSSKKAAKGAQDAIQQFQAAEKIKRKQKNRERDRSFKERAEEAKAKANTSKKAKGKGKARAEQGGKDQISVLDDAREEEDNEDGPRDELEARMERAMREAAEESDEDDRGSDLEGMDEIVEGSSDEGSEEGEDDEESLSSGDEDESEEGLSEEEDEDTAASDEEETAGRPIKSTSRSTKNYLPDHLFESAFSKASPASSSKRRVEDSEDAAKQPSKKRKRTKQSSKDITIGSRTIRTLTNPSLAVPSATPRALLPPARVNKFLQHSLNLKGSADKSKKKGWDRRPANVGIMKRNGPAASFVRNR